MTEYEELPNSPEDLELNRQLRALERFAPRTGFEDRVMARVRQPAPVVVRSRRLAALASPGRLWWATGLAAASSTAWLATLGRWVVGGGVSTLGAWLSTTVLVPAWTAMLQLNALAAQFLAGYAQVVYQAVGNTIFVALAGSLFLPLISTWGLYLTMKSGPTRVVTYAVR
jgi:hypothetical protein